MSGGLFHSGMHPTIKNTLFILLAAVPGPTSAQPVQLTTDPVDHYFPRFSPDGEWILYTREGEGGDTLVYKISANGGFEIPVAPSGGITSIQTGLPTVGRSAVKKSIRQDTARSTRYGPTAPENKA